MIAFQTNKRGVKIVYTPDRYTGDGHWIVESLSTDGRVTLSRCFIFEERDLLNTPDQEAEDETDFQYQMPEAEISFLFNFATRKMGYYRIKGRKLGIPNDVWIVDEGIILARKLFIAERNIQIFRRVAKLREDDEPIIIGGEHEGNIPVNVFNELLEKFPNSGEMNRYASARVETIIGEFFNGMKSARDKYEIYLSTRKSSVNDTPLEQGQLLQAEIDKFVYLRETISEWLKNTTGYTEKDWQKMIIKIILLMFPKYIAVLENVQIADAYSVAGKTKKRFIDLCLVDASGNIDIIEIKKPFDNKLLYKTTYRDNNLPTRELSGSVMQAEKYLFHLSKWGVLGERELTKRYSSDLPNNMTIRVTNPKAMIILGRDKLPNGEPALSESQMLDFEIIKRQYANVMDILTYDDLLRRLDNTIASLKQRLSA